MLLFFFICFVVLICIGILLRFGRLEVKLIQIEKGNLKKYKDISTIRLGLTLGSFFRIFEIKIKEKGEKIYHKTFEKIKRMNLEKQWVKKWNDEFNQFKMKDRIKWMIKQWEDKKIKIEIQKLDLKSWIGLDDVILTSYAVAILSIILSTYLMKEGNVKRKKDYYYQINPVYMGKLGYQMELTAIFQIRLWDVWRILSEISKKKKQGEKKQKTIIVPG